MSGQLGRPSRGRMRRLARAHASAGLLAASIALGAGLRYRQFSMSGQTHEGFHLGLLLINTTTIGTMTVAAMTIGLIFVLGRRLIGPFAGVAAAAFFAVTSVLPAVEGLWDNAEHFVLSFALVGILSFFRWLDDPRDRYLMGSGLLLGCGISMDQKGAAFLLFVTLCLGWKLFVTRTGEWQTALRSSASLVGGTALPFVAMASVALAAGNFDEFWHRAVGFWFPDIVNSSVGQGWSNFSSHGQVIWRQASAVGLMAAVAPLCLDWSPTRRIASTRLLLFALLSFLAVCPGLNFSPHEFILLLPAVAILAGASLDRCYRIVCEFTDNGLLRALPGTLALVIVLLTLAVNQADLSPVSPNSTLLQRTMLQR